MAIERMNRGGIIQRSRCQMRMANSRVRAVTIDSWTSARTVCRPTQRLLGRRRRSWWRRYGRRQTRSRLHLCRSRYRRFCQRFADADRRRQRHRGRRPHVGAAPSPRSRNLGRSGIAAMAISAVDNARLDARARVHDAPLAELLGAERERVPVYGSGGFTSYTLDTLQHAARCAI